MVESLTSFFSQHGINSSEPESPASPSPTPSPSTVSRDLPETRNTSNTSAAAANSHTNNNNIGDSNYGQANSSAAAAAAAEPISPPFRASFPRVMDAVAPAAVGGAGLAPGSAAATQRWHLRRNAEPQVLVRDPFFPLVTAR